jgi:hypothetical protein
VKNATDLNNFAGARNAGYALTVFAALSLSLGFVGRANAQAANASANFSRYSALEHAASGKCDKGQIRHRPIQDFLAAQGTTSTFLSDPQHAIPDYATGWTTASFCTVQDPLGTTPSQCHGRISVVDYTGGANEYLKKHGPPSMNLGTTTDGVIVEQQQPDCSVQVSVSLHTLNALTFTSSWDPSGPPTQSAEPNQRLFGSSVLDIVNDPAHHAPALGDANLTLVYDTPNLGDPVPDLVKLFTVANAYPQIQLVSIDMYARATGALTLVMGGGPGLNIVLQSSVFTNPLIDGSDYGFFAEVVEVRPNP